MAGFIVPTTLATPSDLAAWTTTAAPANALPVLRSCTTMVLAATKLAVYDTDAVTGLATDAHVLAAMRDATCIQAAAWGALGIDPLTGGIDAGGVKKSKKIGSASFEIAGAETTAAGKAYAAHNLVPEAEAKLRQQNLISKMPGSR
jgi:hypothetical protein